jgi:hypothetical protein
LYNLETNPNIIKTFKYDSGGVNSISDGIDLATGSQNQIQPVLTTVKNTMFNAIATSGQIKLDINQIDFSTQKPSNPTVSNS